MHWNKTAILQEHVAYLSGPLTSCSYPAVRLSTDVQWELLNTLSCQQHSVLTALAAWRRKLRPDATVCENYRSCRDWRTVRVSLFSRSSSGCRIPSDVPQESSSRSAQHTPVWETPESPQTAIRDAISGNPTPLAQAD